MSNPATDIQLLAEMLHGKERFYSFMSMIFFRIPDEELLDMYIEAAPFLAQFVSSVEAADITSAELTSLADRILSMDAAGRAAYLADCSRAYSSSFYIGKIVPLTESNYLSSTGNYNEENVDQVLAEYSQTGYKAELPNANEPADHIGFELGFMADLSARAAYCADNDDIELMLKGLRIQAAFFDAHLGRWYEAFCKRVLVKGHRDAFFHVLTAVLKAFLKEDRELIRELTI